VDQYRDLKAFRMAVALADGLHPVVRAWPHFERSTLGMQLIRAADSIGANIAEGYGRWHRPDQRRYLYIARGPLYETQYWLARARAHGLIDQATVDRAEDLGKVLNGLINAHART
jgi:four helix bundle protein